MIRFLLAPIIGGIIGYITNELAIKMLFRPRRAFYVGSWHVPFTPGLIHQQKDRIAASVGRVISSQLLNSETIRETLLSEKALELMRGKIRETIDQCGKDTRTVGDILESCAGAERLEDYRQAIQERGTQFLMERTSRAGIGARIVQTAMDGLKDKLQTGMFAMFLDDSILKGAQGAIGKVVDDMICENAPAMIRNELEKLGDDVLSMPLCDVYELQKAHVPELVEGVTGIYKAALEHNLDKILEVVNIEGIVAERVSSFDAMELENMIFGIMKKELNAIVYLGALLGFLMGFINLLF